MLHSKLLSLIFTAAACREAAAAGLLNRPYDLHARQDAADGDGDGVTVSTLTPESVETSTLEASTTDVLISEVSSTWTLGTDATDSSDVDIPSTTLSTVLGSATISSVFGTESIVISLESDGQSSVELPSISTTVVLPAIDTTVSISALKTVVSMDDLVTTVSIPDDSTVVTFEGVTTTITITGTSSAVTVKGPSTEVSIEGVSSIVNIASTESVVSFDSTTLSTQNPGPEQSLYTLSYAAPSTVSLSYGSTATVTLTRSGTSFALKFTSTIVELTLKASTATVTGTGSTTEITHSAVVTTITLSETMSSTSVEGSETTAVVGESSTETQEVSSEATDTATTSSSSSIPSTSSFSSSSSPSSSSVQTPTTNPTYCEVTRNTLTPEEEVQLAVLFGDSSGGTTFADYVVSYASRLVAQIADVANDAVGDNNYAFTTAFDTIDVPGVLGLASAAPIYTCFLSTLWAQALANPQQYAKRAVPSEDEKIKLIVLFEKRATDGMQFDYAELLVDDTNSLISDVQSVAGAAGAAAVGGDLSAYASLFANVDVAQFLSIATEAPIYTEALSSAFVTALESYSQAVNAPTTVIMTTNTYTTVSTIVTNVVNGTHTVPITYYSTIVFTSVGSVNTERGTYTSHTTETRMSVTSETVSMVVRESTLPNGQVTRITETVAAEGGAPTVQDTDRVTVATEIVTVNGKVETRTVMTRRESSLEAAKPSSLTAVAVVTRVVTTNRPSVTYFTQVQGGRTYIHTVEIQHMNAALKKAVALGTGLMGLLAILL